MESPFSTNASDSSHLFTQWEPTKVVVVGLNLNSNAIVQEAAKIFGVEVANSNTGLEFSNERDILFVVEHFDGTLFTKLEENKSNRIISSTLLLSLRSDNRNNATEILQKLSLKSKPLYTLTLRNVVMALGTREKHESPGRPRKYWADLAFYMGASVKKEVKMNVTHFIVWNSDCEGYGAALAKDTRILSYEWIGHCWDNRDDPHFEATQGSTERPFKWKPFKKLSLLFVGFNPGQVRDMATLTRENEGIVASERNICTHLVLHEDEAKPRDVDKWQKVVSVDWFWASIKMEGRATESLYPFNEKVKMSSASSLPQYSGSQGKKRVLEEINKLVLEVKPMYDRTRSSQSELTKASQSQADEERIKDIIKRRNLIEEIHQTECNYHQVLRKLLKLKSELEDPKQSGGPILSAVESGKLFGYLTPILDIGEDLEGALRREMESHELDDVRFGHIFLEKVEEMKKAYGPYMTFQAGIAEDFKKLCCNLPRLRAHICLCHNKPEWGRGSLDALLIAPVQRIPSVVLLLKNLSKCTPVDHPDHEPSQNASESLQKMLEMINEGKAVIDTLQVTLKKAEEIKDLPATIPSSYRNFVCQLNCKELTKLLNLEGRLLTIFVFSDCLVVTKKRQKKNTEKPYRYLQKIDFISILRIVNIIRDEGTETESLGLVVDTYGGPPEETIALYAFALEGNQMVRSTFLDLVKKSICDMLCIDNRDSFVAVKRAWELGITNGQERSIIRKIRSSLVLKKPVVDDGGFKVPAPPSKEFHRPQQAPAPNPTTTQTIVRAQTMVRAQTVARPQSVVGSQTMARPQSTVRPQLSTRHQSIPMLNLVEKTEAGEDAHGEDMNETFGDTTVVDSDSEMNSTLPGSSFGAGQRNYSSLRDKSRNPAHTTEKVDTFLSNLALDTPSTPKARRVSRSGSNQSVEARRSLAFTPSSAKK